MNDLNRSRSALDLTLHETEGIASRFDQPVRLDIELQRHHRDGLADLLELDGPGVAGAVDRLPGDDAVRQLLRDASAPRTGLAGDRGRPIERPIVDLDDAFDPLHEEGERFELRPLVVDGAQWRLDMDGLAEGGHLASEHGGGRPPGSTGALLVLDSVVRSDRCPFGSCA